MPSTTQPNPKTTLEHGLGWALLDDLTRQYAKSLSTRKPKKMARQIMAFRQALHAAQFAK